MRRIGNLDRVESAEQFYRFLLSNNIEAEITERDDTSFDIWVINEDETLKAQKWLDEFRSHPEDPKFHQSISHTIKKEAPKKKEPKRAQYINVRNEIFHKGAISDENRLTIALIVVCIVVFIGLSSEMRGFFIEYFSFSKFKYPLFVEIKEGQIWRLITPIFLHFGFLHIAFNMLWLFQLGTIIEKLNGPRYLLILILIIGALSNVGEFLVSQSFFGGMSGVVYGLLGFIWMMAKYKPHSGYYIDKGTVGFMIAWLFLCMLGIFGPIANTTHVVGIMTGVAWGYIASGRFREIGEK